MGESGLPEGRGPVSTDVLDRAPDRQPDTAAPGLVARAGTGLTRVLCHPGVVLACRLVIGATFIYASLDKIANPAAFAAAVSNYELMPLVFLNAFALVLPMTELVVGLLLVTGSLTRASAVLCAGMLLMFIVAVGVAMAQGGDFECGCFTTQGGTTIGWPLIFRNALMTVGCVLIFLRAPGWLAIDGTAFGGRVGVEIEPDAG